MDVMIWRDINIKLRHGDDVTVLHWPDQIMCLHDDAISVLTRRRVLPACIHLSCTFLGIQAFDGPVGGSCCFFIIFKKPWKEIEDLTWALMLLFYHFQKNLKRNRGSYMSAHVAFLSSSNNLKRNRGSYMSAHVAFLSSSKNLEKK